MIPRNPRFGKTSLIEQALSAAWGAGVKTASYLHSSSVRNGININYRNYMVSGYQSEDAERSLADIKSGLDGLKREGKLFPCIVEALALYDQSENEDILLSHRKNFQNAMRAFIIDHAYTLVSNLADEVKGLDAPSVAKLSWWLKGAQPSCDFMERDKFAQTIAALDGRHKKLLERETAGQIPNCCVPEGVGRHYHR